MDITPSETTEGLRERKRRETRQRISETALRMFLANGYESTTLDAIATEVGISRRTFFSYFRSKEDIVFVWQAGLWSEVWDDLRMASPDAHPLDAARDVFVRHIARFADAEMQSIDILMRSSESLLIRKQAVYEELERTMFATLCEVWRQPHRRPALRMVAMACIGVVRLALEAWNQQGIANRSLADVLQETFAALREGIQERFPNTP